MFQKKLLPYVFGGLLVIAVIALAAINGRSDTEAAGPERLVFWGRMKDADHGQIYVRDHRGITQLTDLPVVHELWRLTPPFFAFQSTTKGGVNIHVINADTGAYKTIARLERGAYWLPSPSTEWMIGNESNLLVIRSLQGNAPARILGRSPGFPMAWSCAGDAVYFGHTDNDKIIKLQVNTGERTDLTPGDWPNLTPTEFSLSCDERVMAVLSRRGQLRIYRGDQLLKVIDAPDILGSHVSNDGARVLYMVPHDNDTSRVMSYELASGETTELIGPIAAFWSVFSLD